jgi:hypothetical protein
MNQDVTAGYIISDVERLRQPMQHITDYLVKQIETKEQEKNIERINSLEDIR